MISLLTNDIEIRGEHLSSKDDMPCFLPSCEIAMGIRIVDIIFEDQ